MWTSLPEEWSDSEISTKKKSDNNECHNGTFAVPTDCSTVKKHKKSKKRKHTESFTELSEPENKKIKIELFSDAEVSKKKKKKSKDKIKQEDNLSGVEDYSYLELRAKQEAAVKLESEAECHLAIESQLTDTSLDTVEKKKKKKKKKEKHKGEEKVLSDNEHKVSNKDASFNNIDTDATFDNFQSPGVDMRVKKKKKQKKIFEYMVVEDHFSAEETIVQSAVADTTTREEEVHSNKKRNKKHKSLNRDLANGFSDSDATSQNENLQDTSMLQDNDDFHSDHNHIDNVSRNVLNKTAPSMLHNSKSRISERIVFEDDSNDEKQTKNQPDHKKIDDSIKTFLLKKYIENSKNLTLITDLLHEDSLISCEDEVWIVRCPHSLRASALINQDLILDTKCKIKVDGHTYEGNLEEEDTHLAVLSCESNKFVINKVSLRGNVHFHNRIPKPILLAENLMSNSAPPFIPLPETKCRHPLLGAKYAGAVRVPKAARARLAALATCRDGPEQPAPSADGPAAEREQAEACSEEPTPHTHKKKKKKKRKHKSADEEDPSKNILKRESKELWDSEQAIEENLFNF